jgi:hypothetical protein
MRVMERKAGADVNVIDELVMMTDGEISEKKQVCDGHKERWTPEQVVQALVKTGR